VIRDWRPRVAQKLRHPALAALLLDLSLSALLLVVVAINGSSSTSISQRT
jgi:hypothetical protein